MCLESQQGAHQFLTLSDAEFSSFKAKFGKKSLGKLKEAIKSSTEADGSFKETFLLFVLGNFLCPSVKDEPSPKLYEALSIYQMRHNIIGPSLFFNGLSRVSRTAKKSVGQGLEDTFIS